MSDNNLVFLAAVLSAALITACGDDDGATASGGDGGSGGHEDTGGTGGEGGSSRGETGADTCPGDPYELSLGTPLELHGTTAGRQGDYSSFCGVGTGSGPDAVYAFTATESGSLTLKLESSGELNGVLYVQEDCGNPAVGSFLNCQDAGNGVETIALDAPAGSVYYVFVDGRDGTQGDYALTASLTAATCGDDVINPLTEDCDFADHDPGDGCDASCQFEPPTDNSDVCPGQVTPIAVGTHVIRGFTTGHTDNYTICGALMDSPDRVFALVPEADGTITVTLPNLGVAGGGFDGVLGAWADTCDPSTTTMPPYLGCSDAIDDPPATETLSFPVNADSVYYLLVDGYASYSWGDFALTISLE